MLIKVLDKELYRAERDSGFAPKRKGDAGIDLRSTETVEIGIKQTAKIPLGVAIEIPDGYVGWLTGRSSTVDAFGVLSHEGKIDAGYRGEIHAVITALERGCKIVRGERICQLVVLPIMEPIWDEVDSLSESERGEHGLGSTGRT